jgi:beta-phosphoglucomutase-like phosphatase (HAD superfamily)
VLEPSRSALDEAHPENKPMPKAVIFDVDGTLVDSVDLHAKAWQDAFRDYGHEIPSTISVRRSAGAATS